MWLNVVSFAVYTRCQALAAVRAGAAHRSGPWLEGFEGPSAAGVFARITVGYPNHW